MVVAKHRIEDERARDLTLAWTIEALHRHKELPKLHTLLGKRATHQAQTVDQQRAALQMMAEQYGIPLRKARRGTRG